MDNAILISWPIKAKTPDNFYLFLGQLENPDENTVKSMQLELRFLYPFKYSVRNICSNIEDINFFRKKYKLSADIRLIGAIQLEQKHVSFRTPVLYKNNLPMARIFSPRSVVPEKNRICIVLSYPSPVDRGILMDYVLEYMPKFIFLTGNRYGKNKDSTCTLYTRYLLTRGIPMKKIVKIREDSADPECILDILEIIKMMGEAENELCIACMPEDVSRVRQALNLWRKEKIVSPRKYVYLCPP